jgi:hypothetical protein
LAVTATAGLAAIPATAGATTSSSPTAHSSITKFEKKQNRRIRRAHRRIRSLKEFADSLAAKNSAQDDSLNAVKSTVDAIVAGVPDIVNGLKALEEGVLALQDGLLALKAALETDVAPALEAIDAALNDETTGLVGLNLARPQFGVFAADGNHLGSTGAEGGQGPDNNAAATGSGLYVVDFNNDVISKVYSVNVFSYVAAATPSASAINCDADPAIDAACAGILGMPTSDFEASHHVLVQVEGGGPAVNGFSVAAISG